jgi:hypothetical protein
LCCVFGGFRVAHLFSFLCCVFGGFRVAHLFSFVLCLWWDPCCSSFFVFCVVLFALFAFVMCVVCTVLGILDSFFGFFWRLFMKIRFDVIKLHCKFPRYKYNNSTLYMNAVFWLVDKTDIFVTNS